MALAPLVFAMLVCDARLCAAVLRVVVVIFVVFVIMRARIDFYLCTQPGHWCT